MLRTLHSSARDLMTDVNNFLKNEAEIITDFKTRISTTIRELDLFQSGAHITYNRVINKMNDAECSGFLSDQSLFMEENY